MTIRRATLDDVPALTAFGRRIFGATFGPDNEPANLSAYLDQAYDEGRQWFARHGGLGRAETPRCGRERRRGRIPVFG